MRLLSTTSVLTAATLASFAGQASAVIISDFQFNSVGDREGWGVLANIDGPGSGPGDAFLVADGDSLNGVGSSGDPRIGISSLNATPTSGADWDTVVFRVRETTEASGNPAVTPFDLTGVLVLIDGALFSGASLLSGVDSGDDFITVTADISSLGNATIQDIRLDPVGGGDANNNLFEIDFIQINDTAPIPEPASLAVMGLGGLLLGRRRRRA